MEIESRPPVVRGEPERFTGEVWLETLIRAAAPARLRISALHFAPGARTAWHAHATGQTLIVTEGVGRVQARGAEPRDVRAGDTITTRPGEWHWHGAAPGHVATHLAISVAPASGPESRWGAAVTDEEYGIVPASPPEEPAPPRHSGPWSTGPR